MNIQNKNGCLIVELDGEIDEYVCSDIKHTIDASYKDNKMKDIIFDCKNTTFIDSSGVGMILGRYKKVCENNGEVFISGAKDEVNKLFEISDIYKIIKPVDGVEDYISKKGEGYGEE